MRLKIALSICTYFYRDLKCFLHTDLNFKLLVFSSVVLMWMYVSFQKQRATEEVNLPLERLAKVEEWVLIFLF